MSDQETCPTCNAHAMSDQETCPTCNAHVATVPTCGHETSMGQVTLDPDSDATGDWVRLPDGRARKLCPGELVGAWWRFHRHDCQRAGAMSVIEVHELFERRFMEVDLDQAAHFGQTFRASVPFPFSRAELLDMVARSKAFTMIDAGRLRLDDDQPEPVRQPDGSWLAEYRFTLLPEPEADTPQMVEVP